MKTFRNLAGLMAMAGLVLIGEATTAEAFFIEGCTASSPATAAHYCGLATVDGGQVGGPGITSRIGTALLDDRVGGGMGIVGVGPGISGTASGSAFGGELHAFAAAHALPPAPNDDIRAGITARAKTAFFDGGTVVSSTLSNGAPVAVHVEIDAAGHFSGAAGGGLAYHLHDFSTGHIIDCLAYCPQLSARFPTPSTEYDFTARVGDFIDFSLYLEATALAYRNDDILDNVLDSLADIGNTAHFYLDIQDPNAQFDSFSGHDYSLDAEPPAAVTEPGTLALLGAGLVAAGASRRRRR